MDRCVYPGIGNGPSSARPPLGAAARPGSGAPGTRAPGHPGTRAPGRWDRFLLLSLTAGARPSAYGTVTPCRTTGPGMGSSSVSWETPGGVIVSITSGTEAGGSAQIGELPLTGQTPSV